MNYVMQQSLVKAKKKYEVKNEKERLKSQIWSFDNKHRAVHTVSVAPSLLGDV